MALLAHQHPHPTSSVVSSLVRFFAVAAVLIGALLVGLGFFAPELLFQRVASLSPVEQGLGLAALSASGWFTFGHRF